MGQQSQQGPLQHATEGTNATIAPFFVGGGSQADEYQKMLATEYGGIEGKTTNRFQGMFDKYVDVANREAGRQASQIGETLGSRGALYSSANLQQQADLRERTTQDIAKQGAEMQTTLEGQRQSALGNVLSGQAGLATAEMGAREAAMSRAYADFMRRSDVPPFVNTGMQWGAGMPGQGFSVR